MVDENCSEPHNLKILIGVLQVAGSNDPGSGIKIQRAAHLDLSSFRTFRGEEPQVSKIKRGGRSKLCVVEKTLFDFKLRM